ncbi:MAG: GNAT family N-acetyltransferase [Saprospiraceae bacterium]|nr:GNAT family N-acetyltransferase [Saprospiraceae bacterium]
MMETLFTERLILRELIDSDAADLFAIRSSEEVNRYIERPAYQDISELENYIVTQKEKSEIGEWVILGIVLKQSSVLVGSICLFSFSEDRTSCELGYELHPSYQGRGLMVEAMETLLNYLSKSSTLQNLQAVINPENKASLLLAFKLGFKKGRQLDIVKAPYQCYYLGIHGQTQIESKIE